MNDFPTLEPQTQIGLDQLHRALRPLQDELSLPQILSLIAVAREPGLSVNDLAERIGAAQQSASRYVSVLLGRYQEEGGHPLIAQTISERDPRKRALYLNDRGRALVEALAARLRNIDPSYDETNKCQRQKS